MFSLTNSRFYKHPYFISRRLNVMFRRSIENSSLGVPGCC
jgi:hypothetical protein